MKNKKISLLCIFIFILNFNFFFLIYNNIYSNHEDTESKYILPHLSSSNSFSEEWNRVWGELGDDMGNALAIDSSDNIYVAGNLGCFGKIYSDMFLVKFDSSGVQFWNHTWGGNFTDCCYAIALDSLDNIYLGGYKDGNMLLVKYNSAGNFMWNSTWGGNSTDCCYAIALDSLDNIYLAGYTKSFGMGEIDLCLVKCDSSGVQQWNRTWGGLLRDNSYAIAVDSLDNIYISGESANFGAGSYDFCLVKYDSTGVQQWNRTWGGLGCEQCSSMTLDALNNIYLAGRIEVIIGSGYNYDICLVKYSNYGDFQWNWTWGGSDSEECHAIALDSLGNIFLTGRISYVSANYDIILVKISKPSEIIILGYDLFIFMGLIFIISVILIKKKYKF